MAYKGKRKLEQKPEQSNPKQQTEKRDDPLESELEKILTSLLKDDFNIAIDKIVKRGYSHEVAKRAVLMSGRYVGGKDNIISNIIDGAMDLLTNPRKDLDNTKAGLMFESLDSLVDFCLVEMVKVLRNLNPDLPAVEAMWVLLLSELDVLVAFAEVYNQAKAEEKAKRVMLKAEIATLKLKQKLYEQSIAKHNTKDESHLPSKVLRSHKEMERREMMNQAKSEAKWPVYKFEERMKKLDADIAAQKLKWKLRK